jgi:hypothetical protein
LKKDKAATSLGLRPDIIIEQPSLIINQSTWSCYVDCYWAFGQRWCFTICGYGLPQGPLYLGGVPDPW